MYTRHEIYWMFQECKTWHELVFTCKWLTILIDSGLQPKTQQLLKVSENRFRELENAGL